MNNMLTEQQTETNQTNDRKYLVPFILITSLFFLWGFARAILDVLNKHFQNALHISITHSALIQVTTYLGYFLMAIPAGFFINRYGYRRGVVFGLLLFGIGALLFIPGAAVGSFSAFLLCLFIIGCGFKFEPVNLLGSWVFFLLVALFDEILMRGFILGRLLHTRMNKFLSLFISSALFALLHIFNPEIDFLPMLNLLLAGMLLGASYLYTKNLCFPISLHLFWNWIQGPVLGYEVSGNNFISSMLTLHLPEDNVLNGGAFGFEGSLICTVLMIVLTILIVWWGEKREAISLAVPQSC